MKKIFTLFAAVAIGSFAYAQRTIDLAVDSIYSPTELNSVSGTGTGISVNVSLKNVGTDTIFMGDTLLWQMFVTQTDQNLTIIVAYPNPQNPNELAIAPMAITRDILPGDTFHYVNTSLGTQIVVNPSGRVFIIIGAHILNRTDGINPETGTPGNNNRKGNLITWFNAEKWPVSANEILAKEGINVYPNPASNKVIVETFVKTANEPSYVKIYDMNGKVVYTGVDSNLLTSSFEVNTSGLVSGVYFVEVTSGTIVNKTKLVVNH